MKIVIIDDERLAREELRGMLATHPDAEVVGEAANVTEALRVVPRLKPDLVFLDIEMPGRSGFDFIAALPAPHPRIIFVTAFDAFALRAFEVNALDYLLKPVHPGRLAEALARLGPPGAKSAADEGEAADESVAESTAPLREDDQVYIRDGDRTWFVPLRRIYLLEAEGNHTRLHFDKDQPLLYRTIVSMEERLPPTLFFRANRAQLINLTFIEKVEPWFSGTIRARLRGGQEIEFSRRQARLFRERATL